MTTVAERSESSILPYITATGPFSDPDYEPGQEVLDFLHTSRILVIGAGGLGCEILKDLALSGFKSIDVIDMDTIDVSNLNRQFLFRRHDVGASKAETAANFVMARVAGVTINAHCCRIQDMTHAYYRQFTLVVCGLDSIEARRWMNATLCQIVTDNSADPLALIPLIDGGTEGFKGSARVILPGVSACYECSLDTLGVRTVYPVCTIANTPRLPEHCVEWASVLEWPRHWGDVKFDADDPLAVDWMYATALTRAKQFNINGVTRSLTLGVVKNIIPAIALTNAVVAAACCSEAFKLVTGCTASLENFMMYSGDDSIFTYTFKYERKENCAVCGYDSKTFTAQRWWTLQDFVDHIAEQNEVQMKQPSLATARKNLYLRKPEALEKATRPNLSKKLCDLVEDGTEEVAITDPQLPISVRCKIVFAGSDERAEFVDV
ncbi:hypothetical protein BABINDRAFT_179456 [Babjeviella inositovora NRRL Y-12698]|uniref:NEDD8-activating enzyme E1 catalytic subunit n=1 Tax=Babjeviella inositovora NRRL Y-12698 TaxID=984486 RepID=A0A1E3QW71_9ASCO|nr:uncharacterized protein BABINDRAFT_179456 [Babjeviella inositovora NRRL Y-12698]ODQ81910.1 hypothetical protein BABINDRAFT_179456 [Babjeviella inositovora NRRL Y-12698]